MKNNEVIKMCESAILVGLAVVVDIIMKVIPLFNMPNGGHISLAGLILAILAFRNGIKYGFIGAFVYSIINFLTDGYTTNILSILLDYIIAFGIFGICGIFKNTLSNTKPVNIIIFVGMLTVCHTVRFISSTISGVVAWDTKLGASASYNAPYIFASLAASIIVGLALFPVLKKYNRAID